MDIGDLYTRGLRAAHELEKLAERYADNHEQHIRLTGKVQGVRLVLSYIEEELRREQ